MAGADNRLILQKEVDRLYASPCLMCGDTGNSEADHSIPISRGGRNAIGNLIPLCAPCNGSKFNRTLMEQKVWLSKDQ